jgi:carbamoylphosphate synthase small subunit
MIADAPGSGYMKVMASAAIDTHQIVKRLKDAGFNDAQAETVSDILRENWESGRAEQATKTDLAMLATKADLTEVRKELAEMEARQAKWFVALLLGQAALIVALLRLLP